MAVLATTVVVHSETICKDTYDIKDSEGIKQQYNDKLNCANNIKCENAVAQFAHTANLTLNEVLYIIQNSNEEFKFGPNVSYWQKCVMLLLYI